MMGRLISFGENGLSFVLPNLAHSIICRAEQLGGLGRLQPPCCILFSAKICDAGMKVQAGQRWGRLRVC
jgi:hypothetical protein